MLGNHKYTVIILLSVVFFGTILFYLKTESDIAELSGQKEKYLAKNYHESLADKDGDFKIAQSFLTAKDGKNAEKYLEEALDSSNNPGEEGSIRLDLASSYRLQGDYVKEINYLKEIVADSRMHPYTKAYAIYYLGYTYFISGDKRKEVFDQIFSDEPYSNLAAGKTPRLALAGLFDYGAIFYRIGINEGRAARLYSEELIDVAKTTGKESESASSLKKIIEEKVSFAESQIEFLRQRDLSESKFIIEIEKTLSIINGKTAIAGYETKEDPEIKFKETLEHSLTNSTPEASARYHYARYLADRFGEKRSVDIKKLLSGFRENEALRNTDTFRGILSENKISLLGEKSGIALLGKIDVDFKNLLMLNGWKDSDFR